MLDTFPGVSTETALVILTIITFVVYLFSGLRRPKNFPPGPRWLPMVGNSIQLKNLCMKFGSQHKAFSHLAKIYDTDILGLKLGSDLFVCVFTESQIRQILTQEEFQGRPDSFFIRLRAMGKRNGITMTDGPFWQEQRTFALRHLRDLGYGKSEMNDLIRNEFQELVDKIGLGGEIDWSKYLARSVMNVLWGLAAGKPFAPDDTRLDRLLMLMDKRAKAFDMSGGILSQMPWLRFFAPERTGYLLIKQINEQLSEFLRATIDEHQATFRSDTTRDFIDAFMHEMVRPNSNVTRETFTIDQLIMVCIDFFIAGSQTTSNTLNFALQNMLIHPEVQEKVYAEIEEVIGDNVIPSIFDKAKLPYTEAVLHESQRLIHVVPVSGPRRVLRDTKIDGYFIPKGTTVLLHMDTYHHLPEKWEDPYEFRPERFLKDGQFSQDEIYLFGYGKRRCLGEALAKNFLFLFFVGVMKWYKLSPVPGKPKPELDPKSGITRSPKPYTAMVELRKKQNYLAMKNGVNGKRNSIAA